jgi:hypothetical protein
MSENTDQQKPTGYETLGDALRAIIAASKRKRAPAKFATVVPADRVPPKQ